MNGLADTINSLSLKTFSRGLILSPHFAKIISGLLVLIIFYMLSSFGWILWHHLQPQQPISVDVKTNTGSDNKTTPKLNIHQLTAYNLFGETLSINPVINDQLNAPITRLKLKLRGIYATDDENLAAAMIEAQNKQDVYRVGNKLPGASGLKLYKILSDRIIMSRNGKFETLLIEDFGQLKNTNSNKNSRSRTSTNSTFSGGTNIIDKRNDRYITQELVKLRTKLSDPKSLSELISVSPAMKDGDFKGFRIAPGKNRALFGRLGLRRNDVITMVNGIVLDDPTTAFSLMEQISSADEINLTIKRGERNLNILFSANSQ